MKFGGRYFEELQKAYEEGATAYFEQAPQSNNPYNNFDQPKLYDSWVDGWNEAQSEEEYS